MEKPWLAHYDEGVPHSLEPYPQIPLFHFLEESARKYPNHTATIFKGSKLTYQELNALSDRLAAVLADLGVKKGDRVVLFMPNSPQFVISYYGVLKAGGVVVASNPLYSERELEHQINDCGAETIILLSAFYEKFKRVQPHTGVKNVIVTNIKEYLPPPLRILFTLLKEKKEGHRVTLAAGDHKFQDLLGRYTPADRPPVEVGPDDIALFQYTGGTTGVPKGAVALHRNLVANTLQIRAWLPNTIEAGEVVMAAIPLFHVYGMVAAMNYAIQSAATLVLIPNPRDLKDVLSSIVKYKVSIFPGVPTMYNAINNHPDVAAGKYDLSSIKACISGSAPLMLETKRRFEQLTGGKLFEGYGLSEAPTATHCNPMFGVNKEGSIGLPFPDVEAKIVDPETGEKELPVGEVGELVIRGPQVMQGYWNMPTETANVLRNGWLYTGDIARMDEEGYFYIVDRKKEMIIAGGYNIYPREVEEVLKEHPKVLEVAVAGIPDPYRGETVKAWIVLKPGETATREEIREFCRDKLARYKIPTHIEFRDELPKTMVGKVLRRVLVEEEKKKAEAEQAAGG